MKLNLDKLRKEAIEFCKHESEIKHDKLIGINDGKSVGTYIEHKFDEYLKNKYEVTIGSSGKGIDLPDANINTDIKVTSIKKPQNSSPFKNIEQKIYGLGHNLLIFVYEKIDANNTCYIDFKHCIFIESEKSGDYNLTKKIRELINNNAKEKEILEFLKNSNIPYDNESLKNLARKILTNPPKQGYLTISNAFQWRLKYNNVLNLEQDPEGIYTYDEYGGNELEDFQTPLFLTEQICEYLKNDLKISPNIIIEPSCGIGNFLKTASKIFPHTKLYGIENDKNKLDKIDKKISNLKLINEDIFTFKCNNINENKSYLIIGNLTHYSKNNLLNITSLNIPKYASDLRKNNSKRFNANNFYSQEQIFLKIIDDFKNTPSTIAFLCHITTSRNIFIHLIRNKIPFSFTKQLNIDSDIFKRNSDICLFVIQFEKPITNNKTCEVSEISNPSKKSYRFGFISDKFYSNIDKVPKIDGKCPIEWKQGIKHDCAKIMELKCENNQLTNKNNEKINIENTLIYPLLKSGDLKKPIINKTSKYIIITQQRIKQDTEYIKIKAPKTWQYLNDNTRYFDKRKSAIYKNSPKFSIFGVDDYSFKRYKVATPGFTKNPIFTLIYSEKAMMLDDASYFLPFDNYDEAYITMLILNSQIVKEFLKNIAFLDSKRPYSKKILKRIDISKCLKILIFDDLKKIEEELELNNYLTNEKFTKYKNKYENMNNSTNH